ncbi:MAG TPA: hypothetical protein VLZ55_09530 [Rhodanobacter sp.]|nr:hypothetical protein [Rhodanobacter sp.]
MTQLAEVDLQNELAALRHFVSGRTFEEIPETYKEIESTKVRLNVLRDPDHYQKLQAESAAKRLRYVRRGGRA